MTPHVSRAVLLALLGTAIACGDSGTGISPLAGRIPLPDLLRSTDDPAFRSGLCAALGRIDPEELAAGEREALEKVLLELYRAAPDGATHSAAGWALRRW